MSGTEVCANTCSFDFRPGCQRTRLDIFKLYLPVMKLSKNKYTQLLNNIGLTIEQARQNAIKAVNTELVKANWEIGRHIVEYEQHGQERAEYGSELLTRLSKDLRQRYGKGFGRRNILDMRRFYLAY